MIPGISKQTHVLPTAIRCRWCPERSRRAHTLLPAGRRLTCTSTCRTSPV